MSASYIPHTTQPQHSSAADNAAKQNSNARSAKDYLTADPEWKAEWTTDYGTDEGFGLGIDQSVDANFFDIAFSQITSAKQPSIDVYREPAITQGVRPMPAQVTDMESFGRAFNFDPVLNLTTQQTGETILSRLDQAGQADLVAQLIGGLPADVINTGFEQFTVAAGIESYDMAASGATSVNGDDVANNIFMHPIKPLQALQGQLPTNNAVSNTNTAATSHNAQDTSYSALIATGLTPSQMTALSATQSEQSMQELSDVDVNLISVVAVSANTLPVQTGAAQPSSDNTLRNIRAKHGELGQNAPLSSADIKALKETIDQLAPLNQNNADNSTGQQNTQGTQMTGRVDGQANNNGAAVSFEALVKTGFLAPEDLTVFTKENAATSANRDLPFIGGEARPTGSAQSNGTQSTASGTTGKNAAEVASAKAQAVANASGLVPWDSLAEASSLDVPPEGLSLGQVLHNTAHTSPTLMHAHAAAPHQATQTIAAKLTQHATKSGEAELQIELDPPELGRVRIQMIAEGDGKIKAQLSFDKPETFLMMQRDSAQLEKALAEAGIDMGDNTLEFSLSSDNQGENRGDGDDNRNQNGASSGADSVDDDNAQDVVIMNTKMDWYSDNNGNLRLDMLT
mgnify:CR=1 FL=1|tara:strand:- start:333080 stop:334960 length:1881 start_codon:yes stop_codon:yes gene_type:complete